MPILWAALAVVGAICLVDLLLTVGVIRRLREHTELISQLNRQPSVQGEITKPAGSEVDTFQVTTIDDRPLTRDDLRQGMLVAFLSPRCPACEEQRPAFREYLSRHPGGRGEAVTVLLGTPADVAELVDELKDLTQLVIEPNTDGPLSAAFALSGYPAFCLMGQDGVIAVTGFQVDVLPEAATR
ncbi:TlpA family protein disulfide reductase [Micromonospora siamensis]|uniref:Thioredoxin domain-containing protein n=1 Tax=Micromonospora siamensis TaxID=299152 RepID=A0A1C5JXF4_9ACTN|nr:hypothetical protein [Micromonospora siamensis]SCG75011.1 hypothetical protein GA0074704_5112 [Micromonospora siamensis]